MSEKRFERWNDYSCKVKDNQEDTFLNWEDVVNKLNELDDERMMYKTTIDKRIVDLQEENEQLRKQIQNYEQLISNSYIGEEETLDGFVRKYVIWENELQKYRKKNKNEMVDDG